MFHMNEAYLGIYHRLPGVFRSAVASLRGVYLRSWRYGPETERLVEEALEREHWNANDWKIWQEERLALILNRAATRVPYYRDHWTTRRRKGDRKSWECLDNWPVLDKEAVRKDPIAFVADDCDISRMFHEHTSGTSGKPLNLWWSRDTVRAWYALFEARCRRWYLISREDRWGILGGQLVTRVTQNQPPFWVWNAGLKQLYMSSYHLGPDFIPYYLEALKKYKIKYVLGYTSSLYALAQEIVRLDKRDLKMAVAITNAEPLFDYQREIISEAFQCPVRETYGMAEIVAAASECPSAQLHLWPEVGWVEVLENNQRVHYGTAGDLVCTGLLNSDMPLVRYAVGDRGAMRSDVTSCICGRVLPTLAYLEGRSDDVLYTFDGRRIGRLDPVFKTNLAVREAQVIQESLDQIRVRYVPEPGFTKESGRSIIERLQARFGHVQVILEEIDKVPRDANGKFRAVVNKISSGN